MVASNLIPIHELREFPVNPVRIDQPMTMVSQLDGVDSRNIYSRERGDRVDSLEPVTENSYVCFIRIETKNKSFELESRSRGKEVYAS